MSMRLEKKAYYKELEKKMRRLYHQENILYKQRTKIIPLETPIFLGYIKTFKLREDLKGRPDFAILEKLLAIINSQIYSYKGDFTKRGRRWKGKRSKKREPIKLETRALNQCEWEKLSTKEKKYFTQITKVKYRRIYYVYKWIDNTMLVPTVKKHYKTEEIWIDPDIQKALDDINKIIKKDYLEPKISRFIHGSAFSHEYSFDRRERIKEKDRDKELRQYLIFHQPPPQ